MLTRSRLSGVAANRGDAFPGSGTVPGLPPHVHSAVRTEARSRFLGVLSVFAPLLCLLSLSLMRRAGHARRQQRRNVQCVFGEKVHRRSAQLLWHPWPAKTQTIQLEVQTRVGQVIIITAPSTLTPAVILVPPVRRCVVHLGSQRHGAADILTGERYNLIVWNTSTVYRQSRTYHERRLQRFYKKEAGPPDRVCLSFTHDRDYDRYLSYPEGKESYKKTAWCPPSHAEYDANGGAHAAADVLGALE